MSRETDRAFERSPGGALTCSLGFGIASFVFLVGIFMTAQRYLAEVAFASALEIDRQGGGVQDMVVQLDRAARLNQYHDTYVRSLGTALLARVQEELAGVSGVSTLTPEASQYVQALVSAVVQANARASELSPFNVDNWLSRAQAYRELIPVMGEAAGFAMQDGRRAAELAPMNPRVATELGRTLLAASLAKRPLTTATDPIASAQAQTQVTQMLADAQAALERAILLKSNYAPAHFELALVYEAQGRLGEAVKKMEDVVRYNPLDVGAQFQLGMLYLRRGQTGDDGLAQVALERAVALSPGYSNAHWFLASVYESQGDIAAAVREVEAVLALNPGNSMVAARLNRLENGQIATELPSPF